MSEEAFLKVGERLGTLRARSLAALGLAGVTLLLLAAISVYLWSSPLALCRHQSSSLFFGAAMADGKVDSADWSRFVDDAIVPRFPQGFTLLAGQGAWRSPKTGETIREDSHVLFVLHDGDAASQALDAIAADYKVRFRQESVLRVDQCATYRF